MTTDCVTSRRPRPTPLRGVGHDDATPDPDFVARLRSQLVAAATRPPAADPGSW